MAENVHAATVTELLDSLLTDLGGECLLVDPPASVLHAVAGLGPEDDHDHDDHDDSPISDVRVLASESVLKSIRDEFLTAAALADHVEADRVSLRVLDEDVDYTLLSTEDTLYTIVQALDDSPVALAADDDGFIADVHATHAEAFEAAEPFDLRTPGRTRLHEALAADLGEAVDSDFAAVLDSLDAVTDETLDEITLALLVAARNEALLYDITRWGERVEIASTATFSRVKVGLEDDGLLDTENVPIDVGRPRQRLLLDHDELAAADIDEFAAVAQRVLA